MEAAGRLGWQPPEFTNNKETKSLWVLCPCVFRCYAYCLAAGAIKSSLGLSAVIATGLCYSSLILAVASAPTPRRWVLGFTSYLHPEGKVLAYT